MASFHKHYVAGDPRSERRLKRVIPLIVAQIAKIHKRRSGKSLTDEEEEDVAAQVEEMLHDGKACDKAIRRISESLQDPRASVIGSEVSNITGLQRLLDDGESIATDDIPLLTPQPPDTAPLDPPPKHVRRQQTIDQDVWAHLTEVSHEEHLREEEEQKRSRVAKRSRQREALDEQMVLKMRQAEGEREEAHLEHLESLRQVGEWNEAQRLKEQRVREVNAQVKTDRDAQLRDRLARRRRDADERLRQEKELYEQAMQQEKEEQEKLQQKRLVAVEGVRRNAYYNEKQRQLKEQAVVEEQKLDARLAKEHAVRLEKEERVRNAMLAEIARKQQIQKEMGEAMDQSLAEKAAADERRALITTQKHIEAQQMAERVKRQQQEQRSQRTIRFLQRQIEYKEEQREQERLQDEQEKERIRCEVEAAVAEEARAKRSRKETDRSFLRQVIGQIRERQGHIEESMTDRERQLNSKLIDRLPKSKLQLCMPTPSKATASAHRAGDTTPLLPPSLPRSRCCSVMTEL